MPCSLTVCSGHNISSFVALSPPAPLSEVRVVKIKFEDLYFCYHKCSIFFIFHFFFFFSLRLSIFPPSFSLLHRALENYLGCCLEGQRRKRRLCLLYSFLYSICIQSPRREVKSHVNSRRGGLCSASELEQTIIAFDILLEATLVCLHTRKDVERKKSEKLKNILFPYSLVPFSSSHIYPHQIDDFLWCFLLC